MTKLTDDRLRPMKRVEVEGWREDAIEAESISFVTKHGTITFPTGFLIRLCDFALSLMDDKEPSLARDMTDATTEALNQ